VDQSRKDRIAGNEGTFRATNETLRGGLRELAREPGELAGFVCECGDLACTTLVHVDLDHYEAVRADSRRFLIAPGHETPEAEDVVERQAGYWVVQKLEDVREIVEASDPRT